MLLQISRKQQMLATIAARASTPPERLQTDSELCQASNDDAVQRRQQRLEQMLGTSSEEALVRFYAQAYPNLESISQMLSSVQLKEPTQFPHWVEPLESILARASASLAEAVGSSGLDRCLQPESPPPFEELLLPFVQYARAQLQTRAAHAYSCLSEQAHAQMEHWLLKSLSELAGKAFYLEFSIFRIQNSPFGSLFHEDDTHTDLYQRFVEQYRSEQYWAFFLEYSALARLLLLKLEQWINACQEFLVRLEADSQTLAEVFFQGEPLGPVVAIKPDGSDPHHHGRTVFLLTFSAERKLLYKPRNMSVDQAFSDLLAWTTACGLSPALKEIQVLNRETYGWMEYVPWKSCQTRQEVEHYYQRAGMLLCLLYLLGGTDMHFENLIACADMPMLIDLETVIGTDFSWHLFSDERHAHGQHTPGSTVVGTGLLPGKFADKGILETMDLNGLGTGMEGEIPVLFPFWMYVNTNAMILKREYESFDETSSETSNGPALNHVMLHDMIIHSQDYQEEIRAGFANMYHLLLAQRAALLAPNSPLRAFEGCTLRIIVRQTYHYGLVLETLSSPTSLRDGADRWIEMQFLQRPLLNTTIPSKRHAVVNAEISALERLDVPWFGSHPQSLDLFSDDGVVIKDVFDCSALERVRQRLAQFEETDIERQISIIRAAFLTIHSVEPHATGEPEDFVESPDENSPLTSESLISVASGLAQKLMLLAERCCHGDISWMGLHYDMDGYRLKSMGPDLYGGTYGIALFLAICARLTGETVYRDFATEAIQPFVEKLLKPSGASVQQELSTVGIGGAAGVGSWVYALTRLSQWQEQPEMLNAATQAALLLTPELVEADHHLDIIAGAGGAILGLLALYEVIADEEILQRALLCARHLLSERVEIEKGASAWLGHGGIVRTGFSHGAAGIAYALLRLYSVTQQQEFLEAASEAINYERLTFVPEVGNWLDSHSHAASERPQYMTSWCYGAAGIGLARLGGLAVLDTPAVRQDLEVALSTTLAYGLPSLDNLCCGNFGRIEFLLASAQRLQRPELLMTAQRHASTLVHRAAQLGHYHLLANLPRHASNPGLFQGYAGIGYELLRLAAPESIPSVLLWE